jgi:hypothetical protein
MGLGWYGPPAMAWVQGVALRVLESRPLVVDPALEFGGVLQKDAVEKRSRVETDRCLEIIGSDPLLEFDEVTREDVGIHAQLGRSQHEIIGAQLSAEQRDHLAERIPPVFFIGLWPEDGDNLVAAQPPAPTDGEQGEQGERTALRYRAACRGGILDR